MSQVGQTIAILRTHQGCEGNQSVARDPCSSTQDSSDFDNPELVGLRGPGHDPTNPGSPKKGMDKNFSNPDLKKRVDGGLGCFPILRALLVPGNRSFRAAEIAHRQGYRVQQGWTPESQRP